MAVTKNSQGTGTRRISSPKVKAISTRRKKRGECVFCLHVTTRSHSGKRRPGRLTLQETSLELRAEEGSRFRQRHVVGVVTHLPVGMRQMFKRDGPVGILGHRNASILRVVK